MPSQSVKENTGNSIVDQIGTIEFAGNITPLSWYREILLESGRVDLNSIAILSDVVYWYRPSIAIDETGKRIVRKKERNLRGIYCREATHKLVRD